MISADEKTLSAIIALNKSNNENWNTFMMWVKNSYLTEGMSTNELDGDEVTSINKGKVRQLRHLVSVINDAEPILQRVKDAQHKASVQ